MSSQLKVGVVGAGVFAGYHADKVAAHDRTVLTGIFDHTEVSAGELAAKHSVGTAVNIAALAKMSDALIIAIPASYHSEAALTGLDNGCHLLVEKPLACTVENARLIVERATRLGRVLQVGHQERIVLHAIGLQNIGAIPTQIDIVRHMPRTSRNLDTSVVMDLMIHDLDLLHALFGAPDWISTEMARKVYSDKIDEARAELGFGEMTSYLSASRDSEAERRWTLRFESGTIEIDFNAKTVRHDTPFAIDENFGSRSVVQDNLAAAYDRFVRACLDGDPPLASGQDGLAAVRAAAHIEGTL